VGSTDTAARLVMHCDDLEKIFGRKAPQPKRSEEVAKSLSYQTLEPLAPRDGEKLLWSKNWEDIKILLAKVQNIDDAYFTKFFWEGRNGVRRRAQGRIKGGHYNLATLEFALVTIKSSLVPAVMFRITVTPSMKSEDYYSMAVFEDLENREFVCPPSSRCECPGGNCGCSHLCGEFSLLGAIQKHMDMTKQQLVAALPIPLVSMKGLPLPWTYAFEDTGTEKELQSLQRTKKKAKHKKATMDALICRIDTRFTITDSEPATEVNRALGFIALEVACFDFDLSFQSCRRASS
jgi:hypothetical protein